MANSITSADLNQYKNLRIALKGLYDNISAGRIPESSGGNTFKTCHDNIFPTESDASYGNALRLTTTGALGEAVINGNAISLQKLLINTLYPTFHQTIINDSYSAYTNNGLVTTTGGNKDHLCFIKYAASSANILPDKYPITNILYSKYAIEIFIKINEALMNCYSSHTKDFDATFSSSTKIYIVDKKLKGDHGDNDAKGIYIKHPSSETGADIPPEGIYLYIGKLSNMFQDANIKMWVSNSPNAPIDITADYKGLAGPIFTSSNKLHIKTGTVYYFGYLEYSNVEDTASKYAAQSGTSENPNIESTGTMTGVSLTNATISSATIKQGSKISNLTIHSGAMIERVMTTPGGVVANTYKITGGTISGSITVDPDSKIATGAVIATTTDANISAINITSSSLTLPGVAGAAKKSETTIKRDRSLTTATEGIPISTPIPLTRYSVANFTYLSSKTYTFPSGPSQIQIGEDETSTTVAIPVDIAGVPIQSLTSTNISITGTFQNLAGPATTPKSFYEQNIYYIFNFIKMIKYIDKASFLTTSKYLHIYILCYKSLLLASIRAANIFYNNRHRLNAVAISYETNFLNNTPEASGGSGCAKKSLNDFVKNDKKAVFSLTPTCTSSAEEALPADTYMGGDGFKYILYKPNEGTADNDVMFKDYDKRILEELDNLSNTKVKESTANLGITNFQIFSSFVLKGKFTITSYDSNVHDTLEVNGSFKNSASDNDYKILKDIFYNNKTYDFNNNYRIKIVNSTFKVIKFNIRTDFAGSERIDIELEHIKDSKDISDDLYNKLNDYTPSVITQRYHPVYIVKITSKDIDKDYNAIVKNTNTIEENINMYKTKIKNNTTLYELHKSRNNLLYNQVLSYLIIVAVIISILVIINVANVEKPLIKSITLACLAVIIILFMSYYIMNTLYIEEGFAEGSGSTHVGYDLCPTNSCKISNGAELSGNIVEEKDANMQKRKKDYVKNFLEYKAEKLMLMIILETPSIVNESLKGNNEKLVTISKNIYNDKLYLKDVLYSKKSDSEMNVDVLKYENKNYDIYIVCVLFLALIMVGSYTINIYTDNKYLDLLILIMVILFVCLFTYFVLYTNRVVRTVSTNYYWGNEYENQYI
jgi:hypothetical protein